MFVISNSKAGAMELQQDLQLIADLVAVLVACAVRRLSHLLLPPTLSLPLLRLGSCPLPTPYPPYLPTPARRVHPRLPRAARHHGLPRRRLRRRPRRLRRRQGARPGALFLALPPDPTDPRTPEHPLRTPPHPSNRADSAVGIVRTLRIYPRWRPWPSSGSSSSSSHWVSSSPPPSSAPSAAWPSAAASSRSC